MSERKSRVGRTVRGTVVALALSALLAPGAGAQERDDCRCVGADGRELENCVCLRSPDVRVRGMASLLPPRARIGVALEEDPLGARVESVLEDSPAAEAGIREGDVITRVGGRSLAEPLADRDRELAVSEDGVRVGRMMALARDWEPGEEVELELRRGSETLTVRVEPEEAPPFRMGFLPGGQELRMFGEGRGPRVFRFEGPDGGRSFEILGDSAGFFDLRLDSVPGLRGLLRGEGPMRFERLDPCFRSGRGWGMFGADCVDGLRLVDLNPELGEYFGSTSGALVAEVAEGTSLGLRAGDVILAVGGREVADAEDARRIIASYDDGETITLRIVRRQERMEVSGTRR